VFQQDVALLGERPRLSNSIDRERGFLDAAADLGIGPDPSRVIHADEWRLDQPGRDRLREMLGSDQPPTAVFASGYYFALDVYDAARDLGLAIPHDIAVIGVDDPPSAVHLAPALSTFRQPLGEMGELAIRQIIAVLRGEQPEEPRRTLTATFIPRASHLTGRGPDTEGTL